MEFDGPPRPRPRPRPQPGAGPRAWITVLLWLLFLLVAAAAVWWTYRTLWPPPSDRRRGRWIKEAMPSAGVAAAVERFPVAVVYLFRDGDADAARRTPHAVAVYGRNYAARLPDSVSVEPSGDIRGTWIVTAVPEAAVG